MLCAINWSHDFYKVQNYDHPVNGETGLESFEGCFVSPCGSLLAVLYGGFKLLDCGKHSIKFLGRGSGAISFMCVSLSFV